MKKFSMKFTPESSRILSKLHPENKKLLKQALAERTKEPLLTRNGFNTSSNPPSADLWT